MALAFGDIVQPPLGGRGRKPRRQGLTVVMDKGLGPAGTADVLTTAGEYIDFWKIAFGTPALVPAPVLREKLALLAAAGVDAYPGGTLLEVAHVQGRAPALLRRARDLGFRAVEVSDGSIDLEPADRLNLIQAARDLGLRVITEVGKKDPAQQPPTGALVEQALADLAAGAEYVVVEARESGKGIGIYDDRGQVRADGLEALAGALPVDRLIWEAPAKAQQQALILRFGPRVSLGNVPPAEALALEALRQGLRGDTLGLALPAVAGAEAGEPPAEARA